MTLNADTLLDRIYLKGQISKWRIIAVVALVLMVLVGVERFSDVTPIESSYIARITVDGIILDDPKRDELFERVRDNDNVKAVLVILDTPGGTGVAGEQLYKDMRKMSKTKPVVAVMRSMATSAGYMTAIGADYIVASEATITGSVGVIIEMAEVTELAKKIGVTPVVVKSGVLKGTPSFAEKFTDEQRVAVQEVVDDFFQYFMNLVAERRHLPKDVVAKIADGRIFSGKKALELKLIDQLGGQEEAIAWLSKAKKIDASLKVKDVKVKKEVESLSDLISSIAGNTPLSKMLVKLDGLVSIWQPNAL